MKKFKILTFIISIALCLSLLAGCNFLNSGIFDGSIKEDAQKQASEIAENVNEMIDEFSQNIPDFTTGENKSETNSSNKSETGVNQNSNSKNDVSWYKVVRVVDGDTFVASVNGADTKVRLIGVDTPESVATGSNAYKNCEEGKIASNFTKSLIEGKNIKLEYDVSPTDKYGRILAYVYLEDGRMLNKVLLESGYARLMTIQPNVKYVDEFTKIQKTARENKKGFWDGFDQWN